MGGCGCPSSSRVSRIIFASLAFKKSAPNLASAAEAATKRKIVQSTCMIPLSRMGLSGCGREPRKKIPAALLHSLGTDRYDASECTLRIMSDA